MLIPPTYSQSNLDVTKTQKNVNEFHIYDPVELKNKSQKNIKKNLMQLNILKINVIAEAHKKYKNIENVVDIGYFTSFIYLL